MAARKLSSARKLFRHAVRSEQSRRISGSKSSIHRCSLVTTKKAIDRESAYEKLQARAGRRHESAGAAAGGRRRGRHLHRRNPSVLAEALGTVTAAFQPTIGPRGGVHDSLATSMAKSAMRAAAAQSAGKSLAACLAESSAAAEDADDLAVVLAKRRIAEILDGALERRKRQLLTIKIAGHAKRIRRFELFSVYGVGAAFASFLAPLPAFTSMSVADIV